MRMQGACQLGGSRGRRLAADAVEVVASEISSPSAHPLADLLLTVSDHGAAHVPRSRRFASGRRRVPGAGLPVGQHQDQLHGRLVRARGSAAAAAAAAAACNDCCPLLRDPGPQAEDARRVHKRRHVSARCRAGAPGCFAAAPGSRLARPACAAPTTHPPAAPRRYTECKALDLTTFSMDPCWQVGRGRAAWVLDAARRALSNTHRRAPRAAPRCRDAPDDNLCTDGCKTQLDKLPDKCVRGRGGRGAEPVAGAGSQTRRCAAPPDVPPPLPLPPPAHGSWSASPTRWQQRATPT